ncbi:MAG: hypothetical protein JSW61_02385 [Candidatus Thorarchaeota archaeon]|nr:MAG: hypothetical protein JSW61_02385 [Candidatus Thorarchaeota archaeon]
MTERGRVWILLVILCVASTAVLGQTTIPSDQLSIPHWYTASDAFDLNPDDDWFPLPDIDVPYSLPLRGYNSHSRSYFMDLGALDWLSDYVEYYGVDLPPHEKGINETHASDQLEFLFELMTDRLAEPEDDPIQALDYVKDLEGSFEVYIPLIVMFDLNSSYDETDMDEWAIHPHLIDETLNDAFPLIDWIVELFWFDYDNENVTAFFELVEEKTFDDRINIDYDFLSRCDVILHDTIAAYPHYYESDFVLPSLILFQEYPLYSVWAEHSFRGMGRIQSAYDEISSWNINCLPLTSLFFGANPSKIRFPITSTILHELCHCIGQTDIHYSFGWIMASTTTSVMAAYTRDPHYDRLDKDLINIGQALQLLGKYLDEIAYFQEFSLSASQLIDLQNLETGLSGVLGMLISSDLDALKATLQAAEILCGQLASDLGIPRKDGAWSHNAPALDVQIDWIIGPGFSDTEEIAASIESRVELTRELYSFEDTTLPSPLYNITIDIHAVDSVYGDTLIESLRSYIIESKTSFFVEEALPDDAWDSFPRNRIFQNISGYEIDGDKAEQWLVDNPATPDKENSLQYRFYIFNLENITANEDHLMESLIIAGGVSATVTIVAVIVFRRRHSKSAIDE